MIKRYKRLFESYYLSDNDIDLLLRWFTGNLQKRNQTNEIIPLFKKINEEYPILESKKLYRSIRVPYIDLQPHTKTNLQVTKNGVHLSSWCEGMKTALDIFNASGFYDKIEGYSSIIVSSKIDSKNILTNYKIIKQLALDNENTKLKTYMKKWLYEKEWVVFTENPNEKFNCIIEHVR